ncbi:MAG: sulfotransferase family protein [Candidatus Thorarchaeota archaeon]|jgi:hypothetical protein
MELVDAVILGCKRCGTSSFYRHLAAHPDTFTLEQKELCFFAPSGGKPEWREAMKERGDLFGVDGTPTYLGSEKARVAILENAPHAKFVVMMRNPVERTYSEFQMMIRAKMENRDFMDAIKADLLSPATGFVHIPQFDYTYSSMYVTHIRKWLEMFPWERFMFIRSEDYYEDEQATIGKAFEFFGLEPAETEAWHWRNQYPPMEDEAIELLEKFFRPHNEKLYDLLGWDETKRWEPLLK